MATLEDLESINEQLLKALQGDVYKDIRQLWQRLVAAAEIEGTVAAYAKVIEIGMKIAPGIQIKEKNDPYANLPTINVIFDGGINSEPGPPEKKGAEVVEGAVTEVLAGPDSADGEAEQPANPQSTEPVEELADIDLDALFDFDDMKVTE